MSDSEKKKKSNRYRVQVLERALDIFDCFSFQNKKLGLSQITKITGLNISTTKRLLSNLTDRGYLQQDPQSKQYQLGMRLFELGGIVFSSFSLRKAASHTMTQLQNKTAGTILLGVNLENQLVYIDKRKGRGIISISSDIGWRRPLHYGMLGMVLMAHSTPEKIKKIFKINPLEAYTPLSITDQDAFSLRLEEIRKNEYCIEREEAVEGIIGIAAPIRDYSRQVVAALGVALPISQNSKKEVQRIVGLLKRSTEKISNDLGYLKI
ncbi:MAG: IclR family transcriptional regulator [Desulfobacteraceae bacterium]|nr:IclR family transcriptional regulator [Desulfobacteraceae bacterium]